MMRLAVAVLAAGVPVRSQEVAPGAPPAESSSPAPALFQRVVVLGASLTSGFNSAQPFGGPETRQYRFANYVEAALTGRHEPVASHASSFLFFSPRETMENQVNATVAAKPSLVIALDAMFWFCYGGGMTREQRLELFDWGLRQLQRVEAPLIVGDIPDASKAVGGMLGMAQMPELSTIAQCNQRLKTWAASRRGVTVFPLSRIMATATANEELILAGCTWPRGKTRALVQADHLHPSLGGLAALAVAVLDAAAAAATPPVPATSLRRDLEAVYTAAIARGKVEAANRANAREPSE